MDDYKPNSNKYRTEITNEKKIEKVILGTAKPKKKSLLQKMSDTFIAEDISTVRNTILADVLIPSIKKVISDIVTNGIEMLLYPNGGGPNRMNKNSSTGPKFAYTRCFESENTRKTTYNASRPGFDYDEIVFESRGDAELVLESMNDIIEQYGFASVGDLYDLSNVTTTNYISTKYGWTNIQGCMPVRVRDGYILKLPKALPLN